MELAHKQIVLHDFVNGDLKETDFELIKVGPIRLELSLGSKDVLVKNLYLSPDPYMRGRMINRDSYIPPFAPGSVITGFGISKVVISDHPDFTEDEIVVGVTGWEEYSIIPGGQSLRKIPSSVLSGGNISPSYFLGVLGMPGLTAYVGFHNFCCPKEGDQVLVSAAAGAVGQLVGQFAKLAGCYVVGCAGSNEKVDILKNVLGYDNAFNYKEEPDLNAALKRYFPRGIDIYFENVGGKLLEATLENMNVFGRIAVCGMISQYSTLTPEGPKNLTTLIRKRVRMEGFLVSDHEDMYPKFFEEVSKLLNEQKLVYLEDITEGLENAPKSLIDILTGRNIGKKIVKL